jgi:hypothetical protein
LRLTQIPDVRSPAVCKSPPTDEARKAPVTSDTILMVAIRMIFTIHYMSDYIAKVCRFKR